MESKEAKQLVILGNGFDLHLGLATGFKDYFNDFWGNIPTLIQKRNLLIELLHSKPFNLDKIKRIVIDIQHILKEKTIHSIKELTTYDVLIKFMYNEIIKIKPEIEQNFINFSYRRGLPNDKFTSLLKKYENILINEDEKLKMLDTRQFSSKRTTKRTTFWDSYFLYLQMSKNLLGNSSWNDVEKQIQDFFIKKNFEYMGEHITGYEKIKEDKWHEKDDLLQQLIGYGYRLRNINIDKYFYRELMTFSKNFVTYLNKVYDQSYDGLTKNYCIEQKRRNDLMESITSNINGWGHINHDKYELLNFNYTYAGTNNCVNEINIHGSLNGKDRPIIGINAASLISNKKHAFKLTKQYQLISNENNRIEKLDLENIDKIIFYGHSLALADYQYFRNIFDRINLIESSVQLIFKYSKGYENYDSIFKLLDRYSQDIDIDVTTTLTLENRLKVEELPD